MGKRTNKNAPANARQAKLDQMRAQEQRRSRRFIIATSAIVTLIVLVVAVAVIGAARNSTSRATADGPLPADVQAALTSIPADVYDQVGAGTAANPPHKPAGLSPVVVDGKPQILYVGTEYCPYCAGLRWSTVTALARFGTWEPLHVSASGAAPEAFPSTATVSFSGSKYQSEHITWAGYEMSSNEKGTDGRYTQLDVLPDDDLNRYVQLNSAPPLPAGSAGGVPFVSIGGTTLQAGGLYDLSVLRGLSAERIVDRLDNPNDPVTQGVIGGANVLTAAICEQTGGQPVDVCDSPGVKAAAEVGR